MNLDFYVSGAVKTLNKLTYSLSYDRKLVSKAVATLKIWQGYSINTRTNNMKNITLCLLMIFSVISCTPTYIPIVKPWDFVDQNPKETGFMFLQMTPPTNYSLYTNVFCTTHWTIKSAGYNSRDKGHILSTINKESLIDDKYLLFPLKSGNYSLKYYAQVNSIPDWDWAEPVILDIVIKPGEISYLGKFNLIDSCINKTPYIGAKPALNYFFKSMTINDNYNVDIKWLHDYYSHIFDNFQPFNYTPYLSVKPSEKKFYSGLIIFEQKK